MIAGALFFYQWNSWRNRLVLRIRRMRQPKYLFGGIVGALYFYWYFIRNLSRAGAGGARMQMHPQIGLTIAPLILLVMVLLVWIIPHARAALAFTEAEVAFLFPAPISRRTLIHFKLLKSQAAILFSGVFITLIGRSWGAGNPIFHTLGWWVVFATYNLHLMGSSFTLTRLMDRGLTPWRRRIIVLTLVGALLAGMIAWVRWALPPPPTPPPAANGDLSWLGRYVDEVLHSGPLPWVLFPFRLLVAPYFAQDLGHFFIALGPALALLALHYVWVIRSDVAFEEASIDLSRKTAERVAAVRSGNWQAARKPTKSRRAPFPLRPSGPPAVALFWKNLVSAGNMVTMRVWIFLIWIGVFCGVMLKNTGAGAGMGAALGFLALILAGISLFWGPQMLRNDFRQDLPAADVLKMLPLQGWQVVLGEVLAPAAILAAVQWLLLAVALVLFPSQMDSVQIHLTERIGVALSAAIVLPCVDLIAMIIPNAAALFFPAWFNLGKDSPRGFETTGQQLILMFGQLLILACSLLPAAAVFGVFYFAASRLLPPGVSLLPGSVAAAVLLLVEAGVGIHLLGGVFERFDLSSENLQAG